MYIYKCILCWCLSAAPSDTYFSPAVPGQMPKCTSWCQFCYYCWSASRIMPSPSLSSELCPIRKRPSLDIVLIFGHSKERYDKFLKELAKGVERPYPKASGKDNPTVGVYEILPTNCMRKAYYERKLAGISAAPEPTTTMPCIRGSHRMRNWKYCPCQTRFT